MVTMTKPTEPPVLYTIGHSNRSIEEFVRLLEENGIRHVVDVRKLPGSNRYPQFNENALAASLGEAGVEFSRSEPLTGRRPVSREVAPEINGWWENRSFHNYADHALSAQFRDALDELLIAGAKHATAVMCSEAVWWRCHRRIIADHLMARDAAVTHIMAPGSSPAATLPEGAVLNPETGVTYPA